MNISMITPHVLGNERGYLLDALESNWLAPLGPYVEQFEEAVRKYVGADYAVAVNSGTAAIHCALLAAGVQKNDLVAVADLTFIASVNPISYIGAYPVFIDSERETFNMDPDAFAQAAEMFRLKAVIVPHLYGMPANMDAIKKVCDKHGIILIEDATEALGSQFGNDMAGMIGDIGCFSFNGNKIITSTGGGMVVTNDKAVADKVFHLATQAKEPVPYYKHDAIGFNYRLSNLCAAIGLAQFETMEERLLRKHRVFDTYERELRNGLYLLPDIDGRTSNRWISCAMLCNPQAGELVAHLADRGIEARRVWYPMHRQPPYASCPFFTVEAEETSVSDYAFEHGICLPSDTKLTYEQVHHIIESVQGFVEGVQA